MRTLRPFFAIFAVKGFSVGTCNSLILQITPKIKISGTIVVSFPVKSDEFAAPKIAECQRHVLQRGSGCDQVTKAKAFNRKDPQGFAKWREVKRYPFANFAAVLGDLCG
ncbi:MAG TPA: hypothetical protein VF133_20460 [Terriglobales bacterium]